MYSIVYFYNQKINKFYLPISGSINFNVTGNLHKKKKMMIVPMFIVDTL